MVVAVAVALEVDPVVLRLKVAVVVPTVVIVATADVGFWEIAVIVVERYLWQRGVVAVVVVVGIGDAQWCCCDGGREHVPGRVFQGDAYMGVDATARADGHIFVDVELGVAAAVGGHGRNAVVEADGISIRGVGAQQVASARHRSVMQYTSVAIAGYGIAAGHLEDGIVAVDARRGGTHPACIFSAVLGCHPVVEGGHQLFVGVGGGGGGHIGVGRRHLVVEAVVAVGACGFHGREGAVGARGRAA